MSTLISPTYIAIDLRRVLRIWSSLFFVVALPTALYLFFGANNEYSEVDLGPGNVSASLMISMAMYGAMTATSTIAGNAALEIGQGWGRQLALTPFSRLGWILSKTVVALVVGILPIVVGYVVGALTTAQLDGWRWPASALITLACSTVFALYGVAFGMLFRSEAAVSGASGLLVVLTFLGNGFVPLGGTLLAISAWTPVYGVMSLARWPLLEGDVANAAGDTLTEPLWRPVVNVVAWAVVFGILAWLGSRRGTARR